MKDRPQPWCLKAASWETDIRPHTRSRQEIARIGEEGRESNTMYPINHKIQLAMVGEELTNLLARLCVRVKVDK